MYYIMSDYGIRVEVSLKFLLVDVSGFHRLRRTNSLLNRLRHGLIDHNLAHLRCKNFGSYRRYITRNHVDI